jgi:hypothetical protein
VANYTARAPRTGALFAAYIALFSRRPPLNFLAAFFFAAGFFTAMNSPDVSLRLVHAEWLTVTILRR